MRRRLPIGEGADSWKPRPARARRKRKSARPREARRVAQRTMAGLAACSCSGCCQPDGSSGSGSANLCSADVAPVEAIPNGQLMLARPGPIAELVRLRPWPSRRARRATSRRRCCSRWRPLPDPGFGGKRPWSSEGAAALHQAWLRNRETVLAGHRGHVNSTSFGADYAHVVTASDEKTARVWDLRGERPSFVALEGHKDRVLSASLSADGTHVVTASADRTAPAPDLRSSPRTFVALEGHHGAGLYRRRSAPMGHTWSRGGCPTRRQGCGICVGSGQVCRARGAPAIWSISRRSARTARGRYRVVGEDGECVGLRGERPS